VAVGVVREITIPAQGADAVDAFAIARKILVRMLAKGVARSSQQDYVAACSQVHGRLQVARAPALASEGHHNHLRGTVQCLMVEATDLTPRCPYDGV
jgi:hypothetical protein